MGVTGGPRAFPAGPHGATPHCLRHGYVTHLAELGWAAKFVQDQVGHSHAATTAVYMSVGDDFKDRLVRAAIDEQLIKLRGT